MALCLSIPELATVEEDGIDMIGFENPLLELISTLHLAHKACSKSQLFLIFLQGFCPSQLNNTLLLILISTCLLRKKDLRLLLLFVGTPEMAPIHLLRPIPTLLPWSHLFSYSFNKHLVSIYVLPGLFLKTENSKMNKIQANCSVPHSRKKFQHKKAL